MIRSATLNDIEAILSLTKACAVNMINNGIYQWNDHYPSEKAFLNDIERNELFVLVVEDHIMGCIVISDDMDEEYKAISWLAPTDKNIYIHRLAVHPDYQGRGYAQKLMDYAEAYARLKKYDSVRLDTFSQNKKNQKFYEQRGYKRLESIYFPQQSQEPFYCYEYVF